MNWLMKLLSPPPLFEPAAKEWLNESMVHCCPQVQHYAHLMFEQFVYPQMGKTRINKVTPEQIISCIKMREIEGPSLARVLLQRLNRFFNYAKAMGWCKHNPAEGLGVILKPFKGSEFVFLPANEMPEFLAAINKCDRPNSARTVAFWLIAYTAVRRCEAMDAKLSEFDFENRLWHIPPERIKTRKPHIVPLSDQVVSLINSWITARRKQGIEGNRLFGDLHAQAPIMLIHKAGYRCRMTVHGLRKVFSTCAHESGLWSIDAIELQLSHTIQGVRGVYNKATLIDERRRLLQWYANKIDEWRKIGCRSQ